MLSNKMLDLILEELKLEKDEEFGIKGVCYNHRINKNGLEYCFCDYWDCSIYLSELLSGELEIFKLPFVPEMNETYYIADISLADLYRKTFHHNTKHDKHRIKHEICFRTKEEAITRTKEVLRLLRGGTDE